MKKSLLLLSVAAAACLPATSAVSGVITAWDMGNVVVQSGPYIDDITYHSDIYDRNVTGGTAGAVSNGYVAFTPPDGVAPGLKVVNDEPYPGAGQAIPDCIQSAGTSECQGPFQSHKRFKMRATDPGAISLVFNVEESQDLNSYRVYEKIINETGGRLDGYTIELGFGLGDDFVLSTAGDGLGFDLNQGGKTNFAFGLFGDASVNQHHDLDGFFDNDARSGFNVSLTEDVYTTQGIFGSYESLFGPWVSTTMVPFGYFWDNDNDLTTDAILMAYLDENGDWIQRRTENGALAEPSVPAIVDEATLLASGYTMGLVDDLSNVNSDYYLAIGDISGWRTYDTGTANFTVRLTTNAVVPEPGALALLGFGLMGFAYTRRRKS